MAGGMEANEESQKETQMNETGHKVFDIMTSAGLGLMAAAARHAMATQRQPWKVVILRTFAAMVTAIFAGFAAEALIEHESMRYAAVGAASYAAPEVLGFLLKLVNKKGDEITK